MIKAISPKETVAERGIYEFKRSIFLEKAETVEIKIFAASRYILYINDRYICEGPCRGSQDIQYYDLVFNDSFHVGKNEIRIEVMHLVSKAEFSTVFKTPKPILMFEAKSQNISVVSDRFWECTFKKGHKLVFFEWKFIPPNEEIKVCEPDLDLEVEEIFSFSDSIHNHVGQIFVPPFRERPIPMIYPEKEAKFHIVKKGNNFIELDAGIYVTAKVRADIRKNSNVKIIYAECYEREDGKYIRDDMDGFLEGVYDTIPSLTV